MSLEKPQKRQRGMGRTEVMGRSFRSIPWTFSGSWVTPAGFSLCTGQQKDPSLCWGVEGIKSELRQKQRGRSWRVKGGQGCAQASALVIRQLANQA